MMRKMQAEENIFIKQIYKTDRFLYFLPTRCIENNEKFKDRKKNRNKMQSKDDKEEKEIKGQIRLLIIR